MAGLNFSPKGITSAEAYLADATAKNKQAKDDAAQQERIAKHDQGVAEGRVVPDLNPADQAVVRMKAHAEHMDAFKSLPPVPPSRVPDHNERIARLEAELDLADDAVADAQAAAAAAQAAVDALTTRVESFSAVCNGDGTITITV